MSKSTAHDWLKLKRVLVYIRSTLDIHRILGADSMLIILTWIHASYAVHDDTKSHMGRCMSFGVIMLIPKS